MHIPHAALPLVAPRARAETCQTIQNTLKPLLFAALILGGCARPEPPEQIIEVAAQGLYSAALSRDGSLATAGSIVHGASLWKLDNSERLFDWNHRPDERTQVTSAAFSPEGAFAVTVEHEDMVLWDTESGASITWFAAPAEVLAIDLSPGAQFAVLGLVDHTAVLFDIRRGGGNLRVFDHQGRVRSVSFSGDAELLLSGAEDGTARLWNVRDGSELQRWKHNEAVHLVELSTNGDRALSVSKYDRAVLWDTDTGEEIGVIPLRATSVQRGMTFTAAAFSADSEQLLTGSSDRRVQLWDANTLQEMRIWTLPKRKAWKPTGAAVLDLAFDPDSTRYWAVASNGFVYRLKP